MTATLRSLIDEVESRLRPADQNRLAALVETFVTTHADPADFTAEEREHLNRLEDEPFDAADPADVANFFAGRG